MKRKPYHIHFVCRGNTYRSRLASAYMATLVSDRFMVSSSGIDTHRAPVKTSETYTQVVAKHAGINFEIGKIKTQTNSELLSHADVIVFMNKDIYDEALKTYEFDARKAVVWHVKDMDDAVKQKAIKKHDQKTLDDIAAHTFAHIKRQCAELWQYLSQNSWVDIVDADNRISDIRLPINWATDKGLWHRGVHVFAQTTDGKYVVGKRAKAIVFAPGMLEVTLGGGVDAGELPLQAARRETHEELGVHLPEAAFRPMFTYRHSSYHPHYKKYSRNHIYVFSVTLPLHSTHFRPQPGEVDDIRLLTRRQMKHLLRTHRMSHFGRLKDGHKLYSKATSLGALPF